MNLLKRFWPVIFIVFVWFIFSSPYFIKNKVPFSSTYLVNFFSPWNAYPGYSSPVKNNAMPDIISQIYPWKTFTIESFKSLQIPFWNPYSFSGSPHLANYQSAVFSPFNILFLFLPFIDAWSLLILLQPLLAGLFMFIFLRALKITNEGSLVGAFGFMFCGFITTWMAYGTLSYAICFLPLALFAIEKYLNSSKSKFLILLSFSIPLSFFSGHFQTSIYFLLFIISYICFKFFQTGNKKNIFVLFVYTFLGLLLSFPQLLPSVELYTQTLRSGIFQKIEVIPWNYLVTFIAPDFFGNPVTRNDWFGHYAEWNAYIGLVPLMLGVYAVYRKKSNEFFFLITALIAILLSFQTPLLDLLVLLKIPVLSTSAASRIIVLFSFSVSVLAAFGFQKLIEDIKERKIKFIFSWLLVFFFIFLFLWGVVILKFFIPIDKVAIAKQNLILPTILYVLFLVVLFITLFFKHKNKNIILRFAMYLIILVIVFDLLRFTNKWMPFESKNLMYPKIPVASEFQKVAKQDRVFGNLGGEATTYYNLASIEGYDAVYIKRYGEFIASLQSGKLEQSARSVVQFPKYGQYSKQALNFLGIKYVIYKVADGHSPWTFPFWEHKDGVFTLLYNDGVYQILRNNDVFPRVLLAGNYVVEDNPEAIINKMFDKSLDLKNTLILEQDPGLNLNLTSGTAKIVNYNDNKVIINTNSNGNGLLFLSDTYYPGWEVYVDGKKSEIYRTNYTFRSVFVPKGNHNVEFLYNPLSFKLGVGFALVALILIGVFSLYKDKLFRVPKF